MEIREEIGSIQTQPPSSSPRRFDSASDRTVRRTVGDVHMRPPSIGRGEVSSLEMGAVAHGRLLGTRCHAVLPRATVQ